MRSTSSDRCLQCGSDVDEACDGAKVNLCPRHRTGSFPLMAIAADYGVEYADALAWAEYLRRVRVDGLTPTLAAAQELALAAYERIGRTITARARAAMSGAMSEHANGRWGRPAWARGI